MFYICARFAAHRRDCVAVMDTDDGKVEAYDEIELKKLCKKHGINCMSYEDAVIKKLPLVVNGIPSGHDNWEYTCSRGNARCLITVVWDQQACFPQAIPFESDYQEYFYQYNDYEELGVAANEQTHLLNLFMQMALCIYSYQFSL